MYIADHASTLAGTAAPLALALGFLPGSTFDFGFVSPFCGFLALISQRMSLTRLVVVFSATLRHPW